MAIITRLDRMLADRKMHLSELADRVGELNCQPGDILEYTDED